MWKNGRKRRTSEIKNVGNVVNQINVVNTHFPNPLTDKR